MEVFLERDGGRKVILFCVWLLRLGLGAVPPIFWAGPRCLGVSVKILKVMGIRTGKPKCLGGLVCRGPTFAAKAWVRDSVKTEHERW